MALANGRFWAESSGLALWLSDVNALICLVHKSQHGQVISNKPQPTDATIFVHLAFGTPRRFQNIAMLPTDHQRPSALAGPHLIPP